MRVFAWPRSPRKMMSCPERIAFSIWRDDGLVVADDARKEGVAPPDLGDQIGAHLFAHRFRLVAGLAQLAEGGGVRRNLLGTRHAAEILQEAPCAGRRVAAFRDGGRAANAALFEGYTPRIPCQGKSPARSAGQRGWFSGRESVPDARQGGGAPPPIRPPSARAAAPPDRPWRPRALCRHPTAAAANRRAATPRVPKDGSSESAPRRPAAREWRRPAAPRSPAAARAAAARRARRRNRRPTGRARSRRSWKPARPARKARRTPGPQR